VLSLAGTRAVLAVVNTAKGRLATFIGASLTRDLRMRLVEKLQMLSVAYYDRHQVGALISRVAYDSEVLQGLVHQMTGGFLLQLVQLVAVGVMLFSLHAKLALLTLIPMPLVLWGSWFFWKRVYPKYYRYWDASSKQASALGGMLSGIRVVKAFAQEDREYANIARSSQYLRQSRLDVDTSTTRFSAWMQLVFSLGGLIVWYVGGRNVLADRMSLGSLIAFLAYLAMFYSPLATLSQLTAWLTSTLTACQRIFELLDTPLDVREPSNPSSVPDFRGHVRFDNVTFGYDRHQPVLHDVSFEIQPGEMVGVVGRSGSGKTTLVNLLARFYDTDDGRVLIDGVDVREMGSHDLRRQVGIVLQEPFLFRGTIWDNLIYGDPSATVEEGLRSAKAAGCHDFVIRSALGYDTPLGERGAGLSGGERQRLSLARALLYDPRILVLDEATSSVDTESERAIQEALRVLARGRTTIAIAHRLSTLRDATRILVFDQGRLAEEGSHQELIARDGLYARLVRLQTQLTAEPSLDGLLHAAEKPPDQGDTPVSPMPAAASAAPTDEELNALGIQWLTPATTTFRFGDQEELCMTRAGVEAFRGIMVVRAFPATQPDDYLSVRIDDREGHDRELGMIRQLADWPDADRIALGRALDRRYFIRTITAIDQVELNQGHLDFAVQTDRGPAEFVMRWAQSKAQDFGRDGKLLTDTEDNRYVIPDVRRLPRKDAELFRRFVYW
jgi:ATP-binding cassette subfamily B protein